MMITRRLLGAAARDYIRERLDDGRTLSSLVLALIDLQRGVCWTYLPATVAEEAVTRFDASVTGPGLRFWDPANAVWVAPVDARLHAHLADFYHLGLLEVERAAEEYRTAINLNPHDIWDLLGAASLAGVPEEVVSLDEAITWCERAVQLEPDDPDYHLRLGDLYHQAGRVADAKRACLRALLCPRPLDPQFVRGLKEAAGIGGEPPAPR